jgi:molybdopterin-synthase adenylyltransferase
MLNRYSRQTIFPGIGPEGQKKLGKSCAVVIGCGALGTVIASGLVRAGTGKVRIIDRDFIEYHNLQRQILFDEEDIKNNLPKAAAAERHLRKVNNKTHLDLCRMSFSSSGNESSHSRQCRIAGGPFLENKVRG